MTVLFNNYFLSGDDQDYITTFVNNATNNLKNDKMIILLGSGKNGKTSLLNEIKRELDDDDFYCVRLNFGDFLNKPRRKMVFLDDGWLFRSKDINTLKYLVTNKTENIIATANTLTEIDCGLLEQSRIIRMTHVF
jgi:predicted AAA+ superfamily ATPase